MVFVDAPSQRWGFEFQSTIQSNVRSLPEHKLQKGTYDGQRQKGRFTIPFRMEADVFGHSGIAQVAPHALHMHQGPTLWQFSSPGSVSRP